MSGGNGHCEVTKVGMLPLRQVLEIHLSCNFFPPISVSVAPIAEEAIEEVNNGNHDTMIRLPNGSSLKASWIVEILHLESFLDNEE